MIQNALAAALVIYAVLVAVLLKECVFLASDRGRIWTEYGEHLVWLSLLLILNLFAAIYCLLRKLALKDTGDKLSHLEKQLRGRTTISEELTERILQRK
jgi:H+/Cl- antiporter ClcA